MPLKLTSIQLYLVEIPLRFSVAHALVSRRANQTGFVLMTADDGTVGVGEFLAREYVMGETQTEIVRQLQALAPLFVDTPIPDPLAFLEQFKPNGMRVEGQDGALGALELALLDVWGKQQHKPVASLLCPHFDASAPRTLTYSAVYPFAAGIKLAALNFSYTRLLQMTDLKVKGSGDLARDLDYVQTIRRAFDYSVSMRLDLNGSLPPADAERYLTRMLEAGVTWFEQPFAKEAWETSAYFQHMFRGDAVLCADESVCTPADLEFAIRDRAFDAINIRIGKNGGLLTARRIYARATAAGLKVQLGALVGESSVLASAGLHFAAASAPLVHYEGCFGKYLVKWDVLQPGLTFGRLGQVSLQQLPAAGLVPPFNVARLARKATLIQDLTDPERHVTVHPNP